MTLEQIVSALLEKLKLPQDGIAHMYVSTALRQARADALEDARIEIRKRICKPDPDYDPSYWNQAIEACEFSVVALKHKDQK